MQNTIVNQEILTQGIKGARLIGILMLAQVTFGILLNFFILTPILTLDAQSVTANLSYLVGLSTLLALVLSSFNIVCGLLLPRPIIQHASHTFVFLMIFASVGFILCALEYINMTQYVSYVSSLAEQPSNAVTADKELFRKAFASGRNEAHFLSILMSSVSVLLFYVIAVRHQLLPKPLGIFAIVACTMQIIAVGHTLFALSIPTIMQLPLLISQVLVPVYLIAKGFNVESMRLS